ncbi:MAG: SLC13 family permease [bacterium]|nr:SLC13 family permease [bacterium]
MSYEIAFVFILMGAFLLVLALELVRPDTAALSAMALLMLTGVLEPRSAVQGFANPATLTVAAMFVLSAGLLKTGAVNFVAELLGGFFERNFWLGLVGMMAVIGVVSGFINNTAAVAIFLPLVLRAANQAGVSPSKLLMPLSFASMFGGVCTLIGTSTNILVNSIAVERGLPAFGMFEFAPLGLAIFAVGSVYLIFAVAFLIPERRKARAENLTEDFGMGPYLTDVELRPQASSVGRPFGECPLHEESDLEVLAVFRAGRRLTELNPDTLLRAGDVLRVRCDVRRMREIQERSGLMILGAGRRLDDRDLTSAEGTLVEAVIAPNSDLAGETLGEVRFLKDYNANILAIGRRGQIVHASLDRVRLGPGDTLLLHVAPENINDLKRDANFVVAAEVEFSRPEAAERRAKLWPAVAIVFGVVVAAATGVVSILTAAIAGAVAMILLGIVRADEAYREAIDWQVVFLLAGVLSLGLALRETGGADLLARLIREYLGAYGPTAVLSAIFFLAFMMTNVISNNASAAILAPIAITLAESMQIDSRPFLMAVTFAASLAFMTPIGYQTNTFIYGPGRYRFSDFMKVGTPLNLILWLLATLLIPVIWPFAG